MAFCVFRSRTRSEALRPIRLSARRNHDFEPWIDVMRPQLTLSSLQEPLAGLVATSGYAATGPFFHCSCCCREASSCNYSTCKQIQLHATQLQQRETPFQLVCSFIQGGCVKHFVCDFAFYASTTFIWCTLSLESLQVGWILLVGSGKNSSSCS